MAIQEILSNAFSRSSFRITREELPLDGYGMDQLVGYKDVAADGSPCFKGRLFLLDKVIKVIAESVGKFLGQKLIDDNVRVIFIGDENKEGPTLVVSEKGSILEGVENF